MFTRTLYFCSVLLQRAYLSVEMCIWVLYRCNTWRQLNSVPVSLMLFHQSPGIFDVRYLQLTTETFLHQM